MSRPQLLFGNKRRMRLLLLLMTVLSQTLFSLMRCNLMAFALAATWHRQPPDKCVFLRLMESEATFRCLWIRLRLFFWSV